MSVNKTANTITVRGTPNIVNILEKVIQANDRPRAEIIIDVELLEVNRTRAKELGLNLSQYQIGAIFSPEGAAGRTSTDDDDGDTATTPAAPTFNLNTISQGISTADFYLTVPQAIVKFLASDTRTRVLAKPQLRGAEGSDLELNLGDEIPVPQTAFGGLGAGGVNTMPISVVQLPDRRRQRQDEAAGDLRERDHPRHRGREQHARQRRSTSPARACRPSARAR